ncbi:disease resistance protein RPV1-like [Syzygium oleosum]|uniref:disease resistance protein RPV1-like n=1 Tax=Syzygium oleosum TaxID=219896 RepID=UPI0024BB8F29|nr:disease resistance protein RPV1-like [Syzygium oleosum]
MQKKLLSDTIGATSTDGIHDTNDGINRIRKGLSEKKVMVVVDNVNDKEQLENLARSYKWFGSGSRIIITVRDKRTIPYRTMLDEENQTRPSYYMDYPVKEMPLDQAILLFSKHAFRSDTPPKDWHNFSKVVVLSIGRLPLTLEVVGSLFANTDRSKWHETLKDLKQVPHEEVRDTLMISFNKLDPRKKAIFLDIACFCIGEDKTHAYYMWDDCGYSPRSAIDDLLLMSLIKIDEHNKFWMHDEIRDLGRYLVKEENFEDAGKRRWVWIDKNTLDVLRSNKENPDVRALSLGISHDFTPEELARFPNLRFLGGERMNFVGNFENLLPNLRWLSWRYCPQNIRATNLRPVNLVVLNLSRSEITHKWGGWRQIKMAKKLKVLNLENCFMLTETPDFSEFGKLEKLILARCIGLSTIDSSIGKLKLLSALNFEGCSSLQGLPKEIGSLKCLSEIFLCSTTEHFKFPETLGNLKSLTKFEIFRCPGISQLPRSIGKLTNLTHLILRECETLHKLPDSLGELESLVELDIQGSSIFTLPDSIGNLKRLKVIRVASSRIHMIPCALGQVETLEVLDASYCQHIMNEIPWEMWSLTRLRTLDLCMIPISTLPPKISGFSSLQTLKFEIARGRFCPLPELPSSLKFLEVVGVDNFNVLPDLSSLVHLDHLHLCGPFTALWSENENEVMLSIHQLPRGLSTLKLHYIPQLPDFFDFKNLSILTISGCPMPHFPVLKSLERLRKLEITHCKFLEKTPDLSGLKKLEKLQLCLEIEQLPNLSKLKNLRYLMLWDSSKIRAVEGLEELISLKNAEIEGCKSLERLPDLSAITKLKTDWKPPKFAEDTIQSNMPERPPTIPRIEVHELRQKSKADLLSQLKDLKAELSKMCVAFWVDGNVTLTTLIDLEKAVKGD